MFFMSKNIEKAMDVAFDYLMSLDDKEFYAGLDEHANGDIAQAMIELGVAEYEWDLYLKKKQKELNKINKHIMVIKEYIVLLNKKIKKVDNKNKYKNQVANMSSVPKTTEHSTPEYDTGMAA